MLFFQRSNDALAELNLLQETVARIGVRATLDPIIDADHTFHVPARTGRKDAEVLGLTSDVAVKWMATVA